MAAGLAQLKELDKLQGWERLEKSGALFEKGVNEALSNSGKEYIFHRIGSMFCLFFTNSPVNDLSSATAAAQSGSFKDFFHYCLNEGVFLAPSPYETGFISMAHSEEDILRTVEVIGNALG